MQTGWDVLRGVAAAAVLVLGVTACTADSSHASGPKTTLTSTGSAGAGSAPTTAGTATGGAVATTSVASTTGASASTSPGSSGTPASPSAGPAALPVAGSFIYHGGQLGDVVVRIAVHSLRRAAQGTVLDWSITPLSAPGVTGDQQVQLGTADLDSLFQQDDIDLMDAAAGKIYRPLLNDRPEGANCVCAAYLGGSSDLHIGQTTVFQMVYPVLPPADVTMDVLANGFVVPSVPVTPQGEVPTVAAPVDLAAPATTGPGVASATDPHTSVFSYPDGPNVTNFGGKTQSMTVSVDGVYSYPGGTMVVWTVTAVTPGAGLNVGGGLPVADYDLHVYGTGLTATVADGLGLLPAGADPKTSLTLRTSYATMRENAAKPVGATTPARWQQCLCSDWQLRAQALAAKGGSLTLASQFPALPAGANTAQVTFPGTTAAPLTGLPVTPLPAAGTGPAQSVAVSTWHVDEAQQLQQPFKSSQWPTPLPDAASYVGFDRAIVDDVVAKTTSPASRSDTENHVTNLALDSTVLFSLNSAKLLPAAADALSLVAARLNAGAKPGSTVSVTGYVSANDGQSVAAGQTLSQARAQAVFNVLKGTVSKPVHWTVLGRGVQDPVAPNDNETDRELNRRVTITYTSP